MQRDGSCAWNSTMLKRQFELMDKNVQSSTDALRRVAQSCPTGGLGDAQLHAMTTAIHNGRTD